jgi:hypothetical protein
MTGTFTVDIKPADGLVVLKLLGMIEKPSTLEVIITGSLANGKSSMIQVPIAIIPDPILKQMQSSVFKIDPSLFNKNKTVKPDLKMRLRSIDSKGMVTIQFSKPLMQIANFSLLEERQAITFII